MFRFTLRDVFWLTAVVALVIGWGVDRSLKEGYRRRTHEVRMHESLKNIIFVADVTDRLEITIVYSDNSGKETRVGPFVCTDEEVLSKLRSSLRSLVDLRRNPFEKHGIPMSGGYMEITLVNTKHQHTGRVFMLGTQNLAFSFDEEYRGMLDSEDFFNSIQAVAEARAKEGGADVIDWGGF